MYYSTREQSWNFCLQVARSARVYTDGMRGPIYERKHGKIGDVKIVNCDRTATYFTVRDPRSSFACLSALYELTQRTNIFVQLNDFHYSLIPTISFNRVKHQAITSANNVIHQHLQNFKPKKALYFTLFLLLSLLCVILNRIQYIRKT